MKKINILTLSIFALLVIISSDYKTAFATSGACSHHLGVNCAVYNPSNGDAICNDGTESSVQRSVMVECQQETNTPPATNIYEFAIQQANIEYKDALARNDANSRAYIAQRQTELNNIISGIVLSGKTLEEFKSFDPDEYQKMLQYAGGDEYTLKGLYLKASQNLSPNISNQSQDTINSCPKGYMAFGNKCELGSKVCMNIFGTGGYYTKDNECSCAFGYHMNDSADKPQCVIDGASITKISSPIQVDNLSNKIERTKQNTLKKIDSGINLVSKKTSSLERASNTVVTGSELVKNTIASSTLDSPKQSIWQKFMHFVGHLNPLSLSL